MEIDRIRSHLLITRRAMKTISHIVVMSYTMMTHSLDYEYLMSTVVGDEIRMMR